MLNLRSLDTGNVVDSKANSDAQHFSRFTLPNFRIPESFGIGNIGEEVIHSYEVDSEGIEGAHGYAVQTAH